ncbi:UNVERIFIED_CONTAM: hypothetical protein K2H54_009865 [Gekko kuhli]
MRIENFLEDKDEENILNKEDEIILDKDSNQLLATNRYAPLAQTTLTSTQECIREQQTSPAASGELPSINELPAKAMDSKSLAEELADAAKQAKTAQLELNRQIMAKTLPVMSTHKRVNGCVLKEQFAEEIEMASSSSGEATLGDTIPEGFQEPEHN